MTNAVVEWLKAEVAKLEGNTVIQVIEADAKDIGNAAIGYIKANGLQDLYQIAITALTAAVPGASWTGILAGIEAQAVADGKQLAQGAVAVVTATAQADLIATGKLLPPAA